MFATAVFITRLIQLLQSKYNGGSRFQLQMKNAEQHIYRQDTEKPAVACLQETETSDRSSSAKAIT